MDEIDRADIEALNFLEAAIAAARGTTQIEPLPLSNATSRLCLDCDEAIPAARLRAVPATRRCRDCADRRERGAQLHADRAIAQEPRLPGTPPPRPADDEPLGRRAHRQGDVPATLGLR